MMLVQPYRNQLLVVHVVKTGKGKSAQKNTRTKDTRKIDMGKKVTGPTVKVPNIDPKLQ
jgi:hypothetical protein